MEPVTLQLDSEVAKAFRELPPSRREEAVFGFSLFVKRMAEGSRRYKDPTALFAVMDEIGASAQAAGMTPEILEQILSEE
jgi:hypothetical protein